MDMSLYRDLFVSEARGHLTSFGELIVHLEETAGNSSAIDELFRHAHSLKGMAATMGYEQIVEVAHLMEDQLGRIRSGEFTLLPALADILLEGSDTLTHLVSLIEKGSDEPVDVSPLVARLSAYTPAAEPEEARSTAGADAPAVPAHQFRQSDSLKSIRIKTETLDHLVNITGELITNRYRMAESVRQAGAIQCHEPLRQLSVLVRTLRDEVFKARMLPFAVIAERFPRLVRDLSRKQGKEVHFKLVGKDIELDRGILEEIAEPIVHILRNAVDHGLESADDRVMAGKPFAGTITLTVRRDKDNVEIIIADDGRGMDPERLLAKGVEKGLIDREQAGLMTPQEAYQLVCRAGFSTADAITDVSGRGVGMDAVREAVHGLSGVLTIQSQIGGGSQFIMRLPITVSIIHALIVRCGPFEIAFPLNIVSKTLDIKRSDIRDDSGRTTIPVDEIVLPLKSLRQALDLPPQTTADDALLPAIICDGGGGAFALTVDHISGQQEIFIRPLASPLSRLHGISGATITGDGRVLFVADVSTFS